MKNNTYVYRGYCGTVSDILKHFDLPVKRKTVYDRLSRGLSIEQAIDLPVRSSIYVYRGYRGTVSDILKRFDLSIKKKTVYDRLSKGFSIEQAIDLPIRYNNLEKK